MRIPWRHVVSCLFKDFADNALQITLSALAVAATRTERMELGTAIALAFARNPMSLAVLFAGFAFIRRNPYESGGFGRHVSPYVADGRWIVTYRNYRNGFHKP